MTIVTSGIIPLKRIVWAKADVDQALLAKGGDTVRNQTRHLLLKHLRGAAETFGHDLNPDCVRFENECEGERPFTTAFAARWMPPANSELEMLGGSNDGRIVHGRDGSDGRPPERIRLPRAVSQEIAWTTTATAPTTSHFGTVEEYHLIGYRNDAVRWVYELV